MSARPLVALGAALSLARWWYPRALEQATAVRLPTSGDGVIQGAEPIILDGRENRGGVLLLHGFGDTPQSVAALAASLHARGYSVHAPLLANHGRTLREFTRGRAEGWLDGARTAWRTVRERHTAAVVVGQSLGGVLAVLLAAEAPSARALVLLAPYLDMPPRVRRLVRFAPVLEVLVPYIITNDERSIHDPAARLRSLSFGVTTPRLARELMRLADRARAALPALSAPTLYVQPRADNRIGSGIAERAFGAIGSAVKHLEWIEGSGHVVAADYARDRVAGLAGDWLEARLEAR